MTLIRTDVQAIVKNSPIEDTDIQEISLWSGNEKFNIYNFYCPSWSKTDIPLQQVSFKKTIVAGDFNAHLPQLGFSAYNKRGHNIEDIVNSSNLHLSQDSSSTPTLFHRRHKTLWLTRWAQGTTGRGVFCEMAKPKKTDSINSLNRADQSLIFQLRTGHVAVNVQYQQNQPNAPAQLQKL